MADNTVQGAESRSSRHGVVDHQDVLGATFADGDILYRKNGVWQRLAIGSSAQILNVSSGYPAWATQATNFNDAEGDPANIGTTADGTSAYAARRDHVHASGLPANVNLLGDRAAANEFIQRGTVAISGGVGTVTFPVEFSTVIGAWLDGAGGSTYSTGIENLATTGFTAHCSGDVTCYWFAIGT